MTISNQKAAAGRTALLIVGILLIAMNLRGPITDVGPILDVISNKLHLSATQAGMLTTLPLLAFAFFSPISSRLTRFMGLEVLLMLSLLLIIGGIVVRSMGAEGLLFIGTCFIGVGIAIANVLLPGLLKRDFPNHVVTLTAVYVLVMGVGSGISSGFAIPALNFADHISLSVMPHWAFSLISLVIMPIIALIVWLPQLRKQTHVKVVTHQSHGYLWHSPIAWSVSLFLGINSFLMYSFISWLPSILIAKGYSDQHAGAIQGMLQIATAVPALVLIPLMAKLKEKRLITFCMAIISFLSIVGLIMMPQYAVIWVFTFGFSAGGGFILGLSFMGLCTENAHQAAALSGMAQCLGYLLAASGPILIGYLHEVTGTWQVALILCAVMSAIWGYFALIVGKGTVITAPEMQ